MPLFLNLVLAVGLFLGMTAFQELGFRIGRSVKPAGESRTGVSLIQAAVFAILGLLLAFQFSRAASRLDYRRGLVVQEANTISDAYLYLDLLSPERQPVLRDLFRRYTDARIRMWQAAGDRPSAEAQAAAARKLFKEIWTRAEAATREEPTPTPAILLLSALNEMGDVTVERSVAALTHTPWLVVLFLLSVALMCALLAGHAQSSEKKRDWLHVIVFPALIAITIFVAFDLEYPRSGLIRIGPADQAMAEVRQSMD